MLLNFTKIAHVTTGNKITIKPGAKLSLLRKWVGKVGFFEK